MIVIRLVCLGNLMNKYGLQLNIGHDLDGNIYDWAGATARGLMSLGHDPERFMDPPNIWSCWDFWGFSDIEFQREYRKLISGGLLGEPGFLISGELEFLILCSQRGHSNHIITSRNEGPLIGSSTNQTYYWVSENLHAATINSIIISSDKSIITTDLFFDDKPDNVRYLLESDCLAPFLVDQPWNQEATDLDSVRIFSVQDKVDKLLLIEDMIANIMELEPKTPEVTQANFMEEMFQQDQRLQELGQPSVSEHIRKEQMQDAAENVSRSVNERLRNGQQTSNSSTNDG